jgi:hypothetical protein
MKWEYDGMDDDKERDRSRGKYYYVNGGSLARHTDYHFVAVPAVNVEKFYEKMDEIANRARQVLAENPKESAGRKKCPMHLLPPEFLIQTANVLGHGADKYTPWNWRTTPIKLSTYQGAMMRHLTQIAKGEDLDESGFPHLAHIAASAAIVLDAAANGMLVDDRPTNHEIPLHHLPKPL